VDPLQFRHICGETVPKPHGQAFESILGYTCCESAKIRIIIVLIDKDSHWRSSGMIRQGTMTERQRCRSLACWLHAGASS
jgi:hypothetical protein